MSTFIISLIEMNCAVVVDQWKDWILSDIMMDLMWGGFWILKL